MSAVLRATFIYLFLLTVFRLSGKRTLSEITTFNFVLLLIIGEATQQALLGEDFSVTNSFLVILTLIGLELMFSFLKTKYKPFSKLTESTPLLLMDNGKLLKNRMKNSGVDEEDILQSARETQGLESLEDIKFAVLEKSGGISIIPQKKE